MNAKEKKKPSKAAAAKAGKPAGFTDANASWLTPKLPSKAALKAAAKAAEEAMRTAEAEGEGGYSSDSEDAPLPGELSGDDSDAGPSDISGSDDEEGENCCSMGTVAACLRDWRHVMPVGELAAGMLLRHQRF